MTKGPPLATGSFKGAPATSKNRVLSFLEIVSKSPKVFITARFPFSIFS